MSNGAAAARRVAGGSEKDSVKSFVKSGAAAAGGRAGGVADVEAIGREQQRRAAAYLRSRGQL